MPVISLASESMIAKPPATSSVAEITPPCRIWRAGLPMSSGRMSKRSLGASMSKDSTLMPMCLLKATCSSITLRISAWIARVLRFTGSPPELFRGEVFHDLGAAAADLHHLRLAVDPLGAGAADEARAAERLHRGVGAELHRVGGEVLQHGELRDVALVARRPVELPGGVIEHRSRRVHARLHVNELVADRLVAD